MLHKSHFCILFFTTFSPVLFFSGWFELGKNFFYGSSTPQSLRMRTHRTEHNNGVTRQHLQGKLREDLPVSVGINIPDIVVELPATILVSMCISSVVFLVESAIPGGTSVAA